MDSMKPGPSSLCTAIALPIVFEMIASASGDSADGIRSPDDVEPSCPSYSSCPSWLRASSLLSFIGTLPKLPYICLVSIRLDGDLPIKVSAQHRGPDVFEPP